MANDNLNDRFYYVLFVVYQQLAFATKSVKYLVFDKLAEGIVDYNVQFGKPGILFELGKNNP